MDYMLLKYDFVRLKENVLTFVLLLKNTTLFKIGVIAAFAGPQIIRICTSVNDFKTYFLSYF